MAKNIIKYQSIYLFIIILTAIGFISGNIYYHIQKTETKNYIKEEIDIKKDLAKPTNNIKKRLKVSFVILISGIFIISQFFNIIKIFYEPFQIGFIFSFLKTYNPKLPIIYTTVYHIIPLLFYLILIRISITISKDIIKLIITKNQKDLKHLKLIIKKYLLITAFLLFYEFIISLFSSNINGYLISFI